MRKLALVLTLCAAPAWAQEAPVERVIVTAPRLAAQIRAFVQNYAAPSLSGTPVISRWKNGVCPATQGFSRQQDNDLVTARIRDIAARTGAPVAPPPCAANIHIYFTAAPQALLDSIRAHGGSRLLSPTPSRADRVAIQVHPIQAWYATATRDEHDGRLSFDNNEENGWSGCVCDIGPPPTGPGVRIRDSDPVRANVRSELAHVYVIADVNQTGAYRFSAVADTIAMLALSEIPVPAACQDLPSVTNLIFPDCEARLKPDQVSDADLAYLTGLYKVDPGESLRNQRGDIAAEIEKVLAR